MPVKRREKTPDDQKAIDAFNLLVSGKMKRGMSRSRAIAQVARQEPGIHQLFINASQSSADRYA